MAVSTHCKEKKKKGGTLPGRSSQVGKEDVVLETRERRDADATLSEKEGGGAFSRCMGDKS